MEIALVFPDVSVLQPVNSEIADGRRQVAVDVVFTGGVWVDDGPVIDQRGCASAVSVEVPLGVVDRRRMMTAEHDR